MVEIDSYGGPEDSEITIGALKGEYDAVFGADGWMHCRTFRVLLVLVD